MTTPAGRPILPADLPELFAARRNDSHKGSFGTLGILGGGPGMSGAALLAARAALKLGAGKVLVGFNQAEAPLAYDPLQPELMLRSSAGLLGQDWGINSWVAGCGIGQDEKAVQALRQLFKQRRGMPLVLDADALNLLAGHVIAPCWGTGPIILTPHPAEAARLLECPTAQIQADRPKAAGRLAQRHQAWVVLKGAGTIVCAPDGDWRINTSGNPGLASAGTGDVLAGMLGALIAQGIELAQAIAGAVWLHGAAADALVRQGIGPIGLTAGELADAARQLRNRAA